MSIESRGTRWFVRVEIHSGYNRGDGVDELRVRDGLQYRLYGEGRDTVVSWECYDGQRT